jgi:hypothetical protein
MLGERSAVTSSFREVGELQRTCVKVILVEYRYRAESLVSGCSWRGQQMVTQTIAPCMYETR